MTQHMPSLEGPWSIEVDAGVHHVNDDKTGNWVCECMGIAAPMIAAAPDMLAELKRLLRLYGHSETEAIIAKAEGTPPTR